MQGKPRRRTGKGGRPGYHRGKGPAEKLKADILEACSTLDAKLSIVQDSQGKLLATVENIKSTEVIQTTAKGKRGHSDIIASSTALYCNALQK
jgi:hypothetical protein